MRDYGLPADYETLTLDGKREARVNAARQWTIPAPLELIARRFVRCVHFVDHYYLTAEDGDEHGDSLFNPFFYENLYMPGSPYHDLFTQATLQYTASAGAGPRGFAKSYQIAKEIITLMISSMGFKTSYATSTIPLTEVMGNRIRTQFDTNERLNDDWNPEYGGRLKPPRGSQPWGATHFILSNHSGLFCTSAEALQRGMRPRVYYLDDPEHDPQQSTSVEVLREGVYRLIYYIIIPMIASAGCHVTWRGTFISKQHLLWRALQTEPKVMPDGTTAFISKVPEFRKWCRIIVPILLKGADGREKSIWPHKWPYDEEEKKRLGLAEDAMTIPELREFVTEPVFQSEYNCNPGDAGIKFFGELTREKHGWWYEEMDASLAEAPWKSKTLLCFYRKGLVVKTPLSTLVDEGWMVYMMADTSFTSGPSSDYKACSVLAVSPFSEGFMLDAWAEQCPQDPFVGAILAMASRWRVGAVLAENVKEGAALVEALETAIRDNASEMLKAYEWVPKVIGFHPGTSPKEIRIASSLVQRFHHGMVKIPFELEGVRPWSMLFEQIRGFNPAARDGGLEHDDILDTLGTGLSSKVLKGLPSIAPKKEPPPDIIQRMKDGELVDPKTKMPHLWSVAHKLTRDDIDDIIARNTDPVKAEKALDL